jgi:hypothetical protein
MGFLNVNYLALIAAAVAAWIFGAVYYGALAKPWVAALGKTMPQFKKEQAAQSGTLAGMIPFILSFAAEFVMAWVIYGILVHLHSFTIRAGLISGAFCWFGFVLTTMSVNNAFAGRKAVLTAIDGVHWLGVLLIIGAVVGGLGQ